MAASSATPSAVVEWRYDVQSSRLLRLLAHGFIAGIGGSNLLVVGGVLVSLPAVLPHLGVETVLLVALLFLVGGPLSLLYLWPMIDDADQRPDMTAFTQQEGTLPWTKRSVTAAALAGALLLLGLVTVGVPFDVVFALVVLATFSPVVVSLFTSAGSIGDDRLVCNGTCVPLRQVTGVRALAIGNAVVYLISYARGTGFFVPRLVTVPVQKSAVVRSALERGERSEPEKPEPDRLVQVIVGIGGVMFLGVAGVGWWAIDDPAISLYFSGVLGVIGILLCTAGWRGV